MNTLTIGRKIGFGFAGLIAVTSLLGGLAVVNMKSVQATSRTLATEYVREVDVASKLELHLSAAQLEIRSYGFTAEPASLEAARKSIGGVHQSLAVAQKLVAEHPKLVQLRTHVAQMAAALQEYEKAVTQTEARNTEIVASRAKLDAAAAEFIRNIDLLIEAQKSRLLAQIKEGDEPALLLDRTRKLNLAQEIRGLGNAARIANFKAQAVRDSTLFAEGLKDFEAMDARLQELLAMLKVPADLEELKRVREHAVAYRDALRTVMDASVALGEIGQRRREAADRLGRLVTDTQSDGLKRAVEAADSSHEKLAASSATIVVGVAGALLVGIAIAFVIIRGTSRVLNSVAGDLDEASSQVNAAASQVARASQTLADGSSEQAASLEETSASLEEMASMTKRNADGAQQAKELSNRTRTSADDGAVQMQEMRQAMNAIKASSDDVAKIIKTIDEIAFQTNILALNAAVEAARAGEAGMGFAVVADEVRSLAHRSAQSAKETAAKIEDAIRKSEHGVTISTRVASALTDIVEKARQMDALVAEIATASSEQSQGISQVNTAVAQLDRVTQSNASGAEESAAAAEELNAQAAAMRQAVVELRQLVNGQGGSARAATPAAADLAFEARPAINAVKSKPAKTSSRWLQPKLELAPMAAPGVNGHDGHFRD